MSKRLCISLLHAPQRTSTPSSRCAAQICLNAGNGDHRPSSPLLQRTQQHRTFTTSPRCRVTQMRAPGRKSQASMSVSRKQQEASMIRSGSTAMLEQFGPLPGTFVPPTGTKLPSWTKNRKERLAIEFTRLRNYIKLIQSKWTAYFMVKPRMKLEYFSVPRIAKQLYSDMYIAFANGNVDAVQTKLHPGLRASLQARISQRQPNIFLAWTLHQYLSAPKCVSYQFALATPKAPKTEKTGIAQAIVRMHSRQSLQKMISRRLPNRATGRTQTENFPIDSHGNYIYDSLKQEQELARNTKDTVEYLVIQKFYVAGKEGPWHIWGTVEETSSLAQYKKDTAAFEKLVMSQQQRA